MNKYNLHFLFDRNNSWLLDYFNDIAKILDKNKFNIHKSFDIDSKKEFHVRFILGFTKILTEADLSNSKLNLVVHESDLPKGKGFAPVAWQILDGKNKIPIKLIEAKKEADSGDIYLEDEFNLSGYELYDEIRAKQAYATYKLIIKFLSIYPDIQSKHQQKNIKQTFYNKRTPEDSELNIKKSIEEQFNLLRICSNNDFPAFFKIGSEIYYLKIQKK